MIKDRDSKFEGMSVSKVIKMMAKRFHIVNVFIKLGLVDQIKIEVNDQREQFSSQFIIVRDEQDEQQREMTKIEQSLKADNQTQRDQIEALKEENITLREKITTLEEEMTTLKENNAHLGNELSAQSSKMATIM